MSDISPSESWAIAGWFFCILFFLILIVYWTVPMMCLLSTAVFVTPEPTTEPVNPPANNIASNIANNIRNNYRNLSSENKYMSANDMLLKIKQDFDNGISKIQKSVQTYSIN
jgi:hypothetical protein